MPDIKVKVNVIETNTANYEIRMRSHITPKFDPADQKVKVVFKLLFKDPDNEDDFEFDEKNISIRYGNQPAKAITMGGNKKKFTVIFDRVEKQNRYGMVVAVRQSRKDGNDIPEPTSKRAKILSNSGVSAGGCLDLQ